MKKISLFSLIFMLSFYNYSSAMQPKFVFQKDILLNGLHYAIGLLGIKSCDSKNHVEIKANTAINGTYSGYLSCRDLLEIHKYFNKFQNANDHLRQAGNAILGLMNVQLLVDHANFCYQNLKIFRKSKKIAKFNKTIKLSLTNEKIKQLLWLTFNTAFPYLCFAAKRMHFDKVDLKNAFYEDMSIKSDSVLSVASLLASLSENQRRYSLYKKVKKETQRRLKQS